MPWPSSCPLLAILRGITPDEARAHTRALLDAGFDAVEVPTQSPGWADSVAAMVAFAPQAWVGAGSVSGVDQLAALHAAGGRLAVSPHTDTELIAAALARGLQVLPGALTPSEVYTAWRAGASCVKLFPASSLGPAHVRALRPVLPPALTLLAVGGIAPDNLGDYLSAGCVGAGLGGELYRAGQSVQHTADRARAFMAAYRDWQAAQGAQPQVSPAVPAVPASPMAPAKAESDR